MNQTIAWPLNVAFLCRWPPTVQRVRHSVRVAWLWMSKQADALNGELVARPAANVVVEQIDIQAAKSGNQDAYRRLVELHQQEIGRFLWKFTRDKTDWEELLQTVFVQAYLSLKKYRADGSLIDWLRGIATHVGYRFWTDRKRQRARTVSLGPDPELSAVTPIRPPLGLFELLENLSPRDRLVLTLLYVEERSVADTARLSGWTESMVKSQAHRARIKLKELWEKAHGP